MSTTITETGAERLLDDLRHALTLRARLRLTACIRGDRRLEATAERQDSSPQGSDVTLFLDVSDRFHFRKVNGTGDHASRFVDDDLADPDARDDTEELQTYVDTMRGTTDAARIEASFDLDGIQTGYQIGDLITEVDGRQISFNRKSPDAGETLYLQVSAVECDYQRQTTRLHVVSTNRKAFASVQPD